MILIILRAIFRLIANHCLAPGLRILLFRWSGISIGKSAYINMGFYAIDNYQKNMIIIGKRVSVAPNVTIICDSYPNNSMLNIFHMRKKAKVVIEDDCWIGTGSIILPGVVIGRMSIINAGSIVTKSVDAYSIMAGIPAKKIGDILDRYRFEDDSYYKNNR